MNSAAAQCLDLAGVVRQRNRFGTAAVLLLVGSLGVCLPRFLKKHRELESLNRELLTLQAMIVANQNETRTTQVAIVAAQEEIKLALNRATPVAK